MKQFTSLAVAISFVFSLFVFSSCGGGNAGQEKQEQEMQGKGKPDQLKVNDKDKKYAGGFDCEDLLKRYRKLIADINKIDGKTTEDHKKVLIYRTKEIYDEIQYYLDGISPECVKKIENLDKEFEQIVHKLK